MDATTPETVRVPTSLVAFLDAEAARRQAAQPGQRVPEGRDPYPSARRLGRPGSHPGGSVTGARAVLTDVSELAAAGPTDLRTEAEAALEALLRAFVHRDLE